MDQLFSNTRFIIEIHKIINKNNCINQLTTVNHKASTKSAVSDPDQIEPTVSCILNEVEFFPADENDRDIESTFFCFL